MNAPKLLPFQRVDYAIYAAFVGFKMWLHIATSMHDGIFRDEFYYLACAGRLDWGYVDQPPLSMLILAFTRLLFGDGILAVRSSSILASGLVVLMTGLFTRRLGGGRFAQGLAMLCVLICPMMLGVHSYFSMNTFDHLFWIAAAYVWLGIMQSGNARLWLLFGLLCGLGLQNKLSMLFFGAGVVAALALSRERRWFASPWLYAGGAVALAVVLPNLLWQWAHGFPTSEFMKNAALYKNTTMAPWSFVLQLVLEYHPLLAPVAVMGLVYPFRRAEAAPLRPLAIFFLAVLIIFTVANGKTYYVAPAFLLLWPVGALWIERLTEGTRAWRPALGYVLAAGGLVTLPIALPFLPPQMYVDYADFIGLGPAPMERNQAGLMPQHVADRHGWRKRAELVQQAMQSLSPEERAKAVVYGNNYGEAGAMEYFAAELGLPPAISGHNNYWLWGPGDATGEVVILITEGGSELLSYFEHVEDLGQVNEPFQMLWWQEMHVFIGRGLKQPVSELWPLLKRYI